MKQTVGAKECGYTGNDLVVLYYKSGKWRVYNDDNYDLRKHSHRFAAIEDVCYTKHVKPENVAIGRISSLIVDVPMEFLGEHILSKDGSK